MSRVLCWFSCGSASAVAAKLAVEKYGDRAEILYCDTLAHEHHDNLRFMNDASKWIGKPIKTFKSEKYSDIFDVFEKTRWLVGPGGDRCTTELKKVVRFKYQLPTDLHVFGFTVEEGYRVERFKEQNAEDAEFPLFDKRITKNHCHDIIAEAGIEKPAMYRLGYNNNNCIGCVKGGISYWNAIRRDFPESFKRMALMERKLDVAINKKMIGEERIRVFLDELEPDATGDLFENIECGVLCNAK